MNWSIWAPGAFDYAADKLGLTYGVTAELNQKQWALRGGYFLMGAVSNSNNFDTQVFRRGQYVAELETRYSLFSQPGKLRTIGWVNSAYSGSYRETLNNPALNLDIAQTRTGRIKYGYVFNLEQAITDDIGLFGRWSWNDGKTEIMAFTDIDASLSLGTSIKGTKWGRPDDVIGIGGAINALSSDHRDFIAAGGLGPLIGDGAAQLPQGAHPRNLLRLRAQQADHADRGLPVRHQSRLQRRPRPGPCLLGEAARGVLILMLYFVVECALSGIIIAAVSEITKKRSPAFGGLAVALPLVSLLRILQLRRDAEGRHRLLAQPNLKLRGSG